jgi:hypothetical protein
MVRHAEKGQNRGAPGSRTLLIIWPLSTSSKTSEISGTLPFQFAWHILRLDLESLKILAFYSTVR